MNLPELETVAVGISKTRQIEVAEDRVITFMGDDLRIYETPSMIADIEYACRDLLFDNLPAGYDSVGVIVNIKHLAATPIHENVQVTVEVTDIVKRTVFFKCQVHDRMELVGEGIHTRAVVSIDKHRQRVAKKREQLLLNSQGECFPGYSVNDSD